MTHFKLAPLSGLLFLIVIIAVPNAVLAQDEPDYSDDYITPPESIAEEIFAPRQERVTLNNLSPDGQ